MKHLLHVIGCVVLPAALHAQNHYDLEVNNVRARFHSHGLIGMDLGANTPEFEVPDGGGVHPMFSAGLWIGGFDAGNALHLAGMCFEPLGSSDWYPGPLTNDGTASTNPGVMAAYDQVWPLNNEDVQLQQGYCDCVSDPNCDPAVLYPGYQMPLYFNTWPAIGDFNSGFDIYQAPFIDYNNDGDYDPTDCDAPCGPGDGSLYFIFNDNGGAHQNTQGLPIGVEVQATPFAYDGPTDALSNTIFVQYRIINRGLYTLSDTYLGLFTDFDLGCAGDDYVGCDVGRSLWYVYNGAANDAGAACVGGAQGYGTLPPAFGATILCGAFQDADAVDNPLVADYTLASQQLGSVYEDWGYGYGDSIIDNERLGLGYFVNYDNTSGNTGNPVLANEYYNILHGISAGGSQLTYGDNGYTGTLQTRYSFPDDSDPLAWGVGGVPQAPWNEVSAALAPGDRRGVGSMGPFTLEPGQINRIVVAFTYARSNAGGPMNSVAALQARVDSIRDFAMANDFCGGFREDLACLGNGSVGLNEAPPVATASITVYPVPASDLLNIVLPATLRGAALQVVDALGRVVVRVPGTGNLQRTLDLSHLADGHYTLIGLHADVQARVRFIKE